MVEIIDFYAKKVLHDEKKKSDVDVEADKIRLEISQHKDQINLLQQRLRLVLSGELPNDPA